MRETCAVGSPFSRKNSDTAVSHMLCHRRKIIISGWEKGKGRKRQRPKFGRRRGGRATNRFNIFVFTGKGNRRLISRTAVSTMLLSSLKSCSKIEGKEKYALFVFFCFSVKTTYVRFVQVHVTESRFFFAGKETLLASTIFFSGVMRRFLASSTWQQRTGCAKMEHEINNLPNRQRQLPQ